ncbi:hypothetical protein IFM89_020096 [Coptis chinensis]|uniref:Uncharacterized protein n=1 Tax=Coptis chinensis TaxID=261450 RepID=A0A835HG12_9MAGN|nr:hypothetical protein IFM89_020096 [Coptis chinensis]
MSSLSSPVVLFPKLRLLELKGLPEWEEEHDVPTTSNNTNIMPHLNTLTISNCPKLKVVPHYLFPLQLEGMKLWKDVGVISISLMSITHSSNLKSLEILDFPHSFLPNGLNQLTSLQELFFGECQFLDFKPEELKPLTMLRNLQIGICPIMSERSREDSNILTHIPNIVIKVDTSSFKRSLKVSKSGVRKRNKKALGSLVEVILRSIIVLLR